MSSLDRARERKRPSHVPGVRTRRGAFGWYLDYVDPWGAARPLTPPLGSEEDALEVARARRLPPAQRRG
jgi:hypothetical protein